MNVLVIGAGGKTGRAVVEKALAEGYQVTAFLHHANGFEIAKVKVVEGDATDKGIMNAAMAKQDAVIYAMGGKVPYKKTTVETDAMRNIASAMAKSGVKRIIAVTMLGLGKSGALCLLI